MASRAAGNDGGPPIFGRAEIFDELVRELETARDGDGRAVFLIGATGIGKSTLLRAAVGVAQDLGFEVRRGRALPADPPLPFEVIRELVRPSVATERPEDPPEPAGGLPLFLAPHEGGLFADAVFHSEGQGSGGAADRLLSHLARTADRSDSSLSTLLGQVSEFFLSLGREKPTVLAIDDLQFADDSTLTFLQQFLPLLPESRIVLLATVATSEERPSHGAGAIERLLAMGSVRSFKVRPMTETELGQYVRWLLRGKDPGHDAVMRWFTQTEGNPLFTEHLVRASTGLAPPTGEPRNQDFMEVLRSRLRNLGETERRTAAYAAVLGKEFDFSTLASASGQDEERLSESLDKLVHGGILREKPGEVYEFVSERVRTEMYAQLTETRRRILHRRAGAALLAHTGKREVSVYELARQFYLGRDDRKAVEYSQRAAELAASAFAFDVAGIHLERALECARRLEPRDVPLELALQVQMGGFLGEVGDLKGSEELLGDAVARARAQPELTNELGLALLGLARARSDLSQYDSARELAGEAYGILESAGNHLALLTAHRMLGLASWRLGDLPRAEHHLRAEIAIAQELGTPTDRGHALIDLANTLTQSGMDRVEEAIGLYDEAAKVFMQGNDLAARARVLMNRAILLHSVGQRDRALAEMKLAAESAEKSRSPIWIEYANINLAQFYAELPDLPKARVALERAETTLEALGDRLGRQQTRMIRGIIAFAEGDLVGTEQAYREALTMAEQLHLGSELAEMKFRFALLAQRRGDDREAQRCLDESLKAGVLTVRAELTDQVEALQSELRGQANTAALSSTVPSSKT
ncbi:MAG: AAA family ATPase [Thermoplasmata archaeon]